MEWGIFGSNFSIFSGRELIRMRVLLLCTYDSIVILTERDEIGIFYWIQIYTVLALDHY